MITIAPQNAAAPANNGVHTCARTPTIVHSAITMLAVTAGFPSAPTLRNTLAPNGAWAKKNLLPGASRSRLRNGARGPVTRTASTTAARLATINDVPSRIPTLA